jgi:Trk K+ transport system NAD-binding subunit
MAKGSDLDRVTSVVLREMRGPILVLIAVHALGVGGMVLIPGVDADGNSVHMGFFHAFYFMTYTATTTGFGELPYAFSEAQRIWASICLYLSVVAWIYGIGSIIRLVQNPHFAQAVAQRRFSIAVARISDPFVIICGFGDTGSLLTRGLSDRHIHGVVIDNDIERIKALALRDYDVKIPGLCGDAGVPKNLRDAGLERPECRAVVLLTGDDDVNLKIAVMTRLMNPSAEVICRSTERVHEEQLNSLGSVIITDPFEAFARELVLALHAPPLHTLNQWLVGVKDADLERTISYHPGTWILCGYGRMGRRLHSALQDQQVPTVVIDPGLDHSELDHAIVGTASKANLLEAGGHHAAGLVAATNSDSANLAILLSARSINPSAHLVVRQNNHENELAFNAASADLIMQPSLVTARKILLRLISPLIQEFLDHLAEHTVLLRNEVYPSLRANIGTRTPVLFTVNTDSRSAPAVVGLIDAGLNLTLDALLRDPRNREQPLRCVVLVLRRGQQRHMMPAPNMRLEVDDELLVCATNDAERRIRTSLTNQYLLEYLVTGIERSRGILYNLLRA